MTRSVLEFIRQRFFQGGGQGASGRVQRVPEEGVRDLRGDEDQADLPEGHRAARRQGGQGHVHEVRHSWCLFINFSL